MCTAAWARRLEPCPGSRGAARAAWPTAIGLRGHTLDDGSVQSLSDTEKTAMLRLAQMAGDTLERDGRLRSAR